MSGQKQTRHWLALATGILFIITAVFMAFNPLSSMAMIGVFISVSIFVGGIMDLLRHFDMPKEVRSGWGLASAILSIVIGLSLMMDSLIAQAELLPLLVGIWAVFIGVGRIMLGIQLRKAPGAVADAAGLSAEDIPAGVAEFGATVSKSAVWIIASGVLTVLLGLIIWANPLFSGIVITIMIAGGFFALGIARIVDFFSAKDTATGVPFA